jgi:hypothetical protein
MDRIYKINRIELDTKVDRSVQLLRFDLIL